MRDGETSQGREGGVRNNGKNPQLRPEDWAPTPKATWREILKLYAGAFAFTALAMHVSPHWLVREVFGGGMVVFMVLLPAHLAFKHGLDLDYFGLDRANVVKPLLTVLALSALVFPLYWLGVELWHTELAPTVLGWFGIHQRTLHFRFTIPSDLLWVVFSQIFLIAFPEEFFFRGYIQTRLQKQRPHGWFTVLGVPIGPAIFWTSLLFAAIHLAWIPLPFRLLTFLPSLLFCWLRAYSGSIVGAILFHGLCNIVQHVLAASYH